MKIALYARVSTGRQVEEGVSIDAQINQMTAWAAANGHEIAEIYRDLGLTATDDRRPELRRMMADATSSDHPFDAVVVFTLSRFFRDTIAFGMHELQLKRAKVKLISISQPTAEDEAGQMVRQILNSFDEYQSRENGKQVRKSMIENAQKGYFNGSRPPFGYLAVKQDVKGRSGLKRKLEPQLEEVEVVRRIFRLAIEGDTGTPWGIKRIAANLNQSGETCRGKAWTSQMVWTILSSSTYHGDYVYNRHDTRAKSKRDRSQWVITKVPAIVSKEVFDKAAALRSERAPGGNTEYRAAASPALLTGIAKCGHCGANMVLVSGKGGHYDYYRCSTRAYKGNDMCDSPNVPREELEAAVLDVIAGKVLLPERIQGMLEDLRAQVAKLQAPDREREKYIQRQIAQATEQVNMWYELVEAGKLEFHDSLRSRLAATQRRLDEMAVELAEINKRRQLPLKKFGKAHVEGFASAIRTEILTPGSKFAKSYLRAIVSEIRISAGGGTVMGSNAEMTGAISGWRPGTAGVTVPRHLSNWRPQHESNVRPSP